MRVRTTAAIPLARQQQTARFGQATSERPFVPSGPCTQDALALRATGTITSRWVRSSAPRDSRPVHQKAGWRQAKVLATLGTRVRALIKVTTSGRSPLDWSAH